MIILWYMEIFGFSVNCTVSRLELQFKESCYVDVEAQGATTIFSQLLETLDRGKNEKSMSFESFLRSLPR